MIELDRRHAPILRRALEAEHDRLTERTKQLSARSPVFRKHRQDQNEIKDILATLNKKTQ